MINIQIHFQWCTEVQAHTHTHTHARGPGLSAITAQWNIFRLERCRITLQPDDKYAVSTIINLAPLPTFRLQSRWCKGRGASIHWMELVPQLAVQLVHALGSSSTLFYEVLRAREVRAFWLTGFTCNVTVQKGRLLDRTEVSRILYSGIAAAQNTQNPSSLMAHMSLLFIYLAAHILSLSFRLHSTFFPFILQPLSSLILRVCWHIALNSISL